MSEPTTTTPAPDAATPEAEPLKPRQLAKDRTRATVLAVAKRLFGANRYEDVTIRQIARVADLSTGAVFANFADKADLWRAAMSQPEPVDGPLTRAAPHLLAFARGFAIYQEEGDPDRVWLKVGDAAPVYLLTSTAHGRALLQLEAQQTEALALASKPIGPGPEAEDAPSDTALLGEAAA